MVPAGRERGDMSQAHERRQGRTDRRDVSRPAVAPGLERRAAGGCRRRPLPEPRWRRWPSITLAAVLGVATAFGLQAMQGGPVAALPVALAVPVEAVTEDLPAPRIGLAEAQALRDEAAALTPAGVALDEQAVAEWLPRVAEIAAAVEDPRVPAEVREELREALEALERVGIGSSARRRN